MLAPAGPTPALSWAAWASTSPQLPASTLFRPARPAGEPPRCAARHGRALQGPQPAPGAIPSSCRSPLLGFAPSLSRALSPHMCVHWHARLRGVCSRVHGTCGNALQVLVLTTQPALPAPAPPAQFATSVMVSGWYQDDKDDGVEMWYTGKQERHAPATPVGAYRHPCMPCSCPGIRRRAAHLLVAAAVATG